MRVEEEAEKIGRYVIMPHILAYRTRPIRAGFAGFSKLREEILGCFTPALEINLVTNGMYIDSTRDAWRDMLLPCAVWQDILLPRTMRGGRV